MSFIRMGHPLTYFKGDSKLYVYPSSNGIVDYGDDYKDNASFAELMVEMVRRATDDEAYAKKIAGVLAKKLNIKLRK